eukprot:5513558-Pleurochrysis_carterae.AAC.1
MRRSRHRQRRIFRRRRRRRKGREEDESDGEEEEEADEKEEAKEEAEEDAVPSGNVSLEQPSRSNKTDRSRRCAALAAEASTHSRAASTGRDASAPKKVATSELLRAHAGR